MVKYFAFALSYLESLTAGDLGLFFKTYYHNLSPSFWSLWLVLQLSSDN